MPSVPSWAKGRMRNCVVCDFWFGERDNRIRLIRGKWYCRWCEDTVTDHDRQPSGTSNYLLLETGEKILLEDGGRIPLEGS